ncbi:LPXTG cell wall anchor domain-containing protein [Alkalihalobacterium chitinilyticum]|uniref:LPXTG cell wall anchor domain-containing protein n=1 Tax=Alkalihalobacterium chitinilyticum TaxID=2980103 RepID=A0ABT5VH00_9BACI|nr:LPXTG cell wall anchor domain-containing protein [Alkalihalobacterium chitinilyticum]MDE5414012.1 LPXTG cell wall anchor domain-containing protein [Alkalihalobacterium chitinilyticum]
MKSAKKLSFISGFTAFALLLAPFGTSVAAAGNGEENVNNGIEMEYITEDGARDEVYENVRDDVYDGVRDDVYNDVPGDVYNGVPGDVYNGVPGDVYSGVPGDVYSGVPGDVYSGVPGDVYNGVPGDVYNGVPGDVYNGVPGDVYNGVPGDVYDGVTGDVYNVYYNPFTGSYQISDVHSYGTDHVFILPLVPGSKGHVKVQLPSAIFANLDGDAVVDITVNEAPDHIKDKKENERILALFEFKINDDLRNFGDHKVTLSFFIEPSEVTNWDKLRVVYIDENGNWTDEIITPIFFDETTGEVRVEVSHFSFYGVFVDEEDANEDDSTTQSGTAVGTGEGSNGGSDSGTSVGTETTTTTTEGSSSAETKAGSKLPDTATNLFNLLLAGMVLVMIGGVLLFAKRREVTA